MISRQASDVNMLSSITALAAKEEFDIAHFNKVGLNANSISEHSFFSSTIQVLEHCSYIKLDDEQLREIMQRLEQSFAEGLQNEETAVVKMLPSFIRATSVGKESGEFLALDLGGSNFRVLLITLHGDGKKGEMRHVTYAVPQELQQGTGEHLFDHVANCLHNFMVEQRLSCNKTLPLGFTFSFPCQQKGLASASLVAWTKGFSASGVVGKDVVQLLTDACRRKNIAVNVVALVNDTVGTMLACSFFDPDCSIGLIVGTGSNACYMERLENISKLNGLVSVNDGLPEEMCINCELGAFGDDGKIDKYRTAHDRKLDANSINPRKQTFEKMISGMYLGELVRLVLVELAEAGLLFSGSAVTSSAIGKQGSFSTRILSEVER
ncbi:unnamed protein product [Meloidogyne enterolobii]|uniref:Uncharacterized protein n=1 Tax=Meloidogyne enterolobii TaxID=390850 RepID=A0ACB0XWD0_MELEN